MRRARVRTTRADEKVRSSLQATATRARGLPTREGDRRDRRREGSRGGAPRGPKRDPAGVREHPGGGPDARARSAPAAEGCCSIGRSRDGGQTAQPLASTFHLAAKRMTQNAEMHHGFFQRANSHKKPPLERFFPPGDVAPFITPSRLKFHSRRRVEAFLFLARRRMTPASRVHRARLRASSHPTHPTPPYPPNPPLPEQIRVHRADPRRTRQLRQNRVDPAVPSPRRRSPDAEAPPDVFLLLLLLLRGLVLLRPPRPRPAPRPLLASPCRLKSPRRVRGRRRQRVPPSQEVHVVQPRANLERERLGVKRRRGGGGRRRVFFARARGRARRRRPARILRRIRTVLSPGVGFVRRRVPRATGREEDGRRGGRRRRRRTRMITSPLGRTWRRVRMRPLGRTRRRVRTRPLGRTRRRTRTSPLGRTRRRTRTRPLGRTRLLLIPLALAADASSDGPRGLLRARALAGVVVVATATFHRPFRFASPPRRLRRGGGDARRGGRFFVGGGGGEGAAAAAQMRGRLDARGELGARAEEDLVHASLRGGARGDGRGAGVAVRARRGRGGDGVGVGVGVVVVSSSGREARPRRAEGSRGRARGARGARAGGFGVRAGRRRRGRRGGGEGRRGGEGGLASFRAVGEPRGETLAKASPDVVFVRGAVEPREREGRARERDRGRRRRERERERRRRRPRRALYARVVVPREVQMQSIRPRRRGRARVVPRGRAGRRGARERWPRRRRVRRGRRHRDAPRRAVHLCARRGAFRRCREGRSGTFPSLDARRAPISNNIRSMRVAL